MELKEIITLMEKAKELGVEELIYNSLTVKFKKDSAAILQPQVISQSLSQPSVGIDLNQLVGTKAEELIKPTSPLDAMSPEEVLYYAVPYYDELQAQKEARTAQIATEGFTP